MSIQAFATARIRTSAWLAVVTALAFSVRLVPLLAGGGLLGAPNYDPAVYYAGAVGLFRGRLPYRDFLLLHPPGILLALQPFAALGEWVGDPGAFAAARVGFMLVGAASAACIFCLLLGRGLAAAVIGGAAYALSPAAALVERATWLEGPATLLCLLALLVLRPLGKGVLSTPRAAAGGALLALAATMKLWGLALVIVVVLWLVFTDSLRAALGCLLGATATAGMVLAPFALASRDFLGDIVLAQLGRPTARTDPLLRVNSILGFDLAQAPAVPLAVTIGLVIIVLGALVLAVRSTPGRLYSILLATTVGVLLASPSWYANYAAFAAAPLALVIGSAAAQAAGWLHGGWRSTCVAVVAVLLVGTSCVQLASRTGFGFPTAELGRTLSARPGCLTTDQPVALILGDRLRTNLDRGCRLVVDLSGYIHVFDAGGESSQRAANPRFQAEMLDYLRSGESTVIMSGMWPNDFDRESRAEVLGWPVVATVGSIEVRQPKA